MTKRPPTLQQLLRNAAKLTGSDLREFRDAVIDRQLFTSPKPTAREAIEMEVKARLKNGKLK